MIPHSDCWTSAALEPGASCCYCLELSLLCALCLLKGQIENNIQLWVHDIVQETGIKTIPMEKKYKKAKWLSGEALQGPVADSF